MTTTSRIDRRASISLTALAFGALIASAPWSRADTTTLTGKPAPDFSLKTVDGKDVKLSDLKGKVVLIDFWATWCGLCRESLPHLQHISENKDLGDKGLVVLAINGEGNKEATRKFLEDNHYTFTVPLDDKNTASGSYWVAAIPTTVLVGRDGAVKQVWIGFGTTSAKRMDDAITDAIKETAK